MTGTNPTPEGVAAMCRTMRERPYRLASETEEAASLRRIKERADAAAMLEALAADLAAQTARADAAEAETNKVRRFLKISRDEGSEALARAEAAEAKVARLVEAADYILDGMAIDAPDYEIDPDDDFLDAANSDWVRDVLTRLAAAMKGADHE